jgi:hypothetical protein
VNPLLVLLDEILKAGRGGRVAGSGDDLDGRRRGEEGFGVAESETTRCAFASKRGWSVRGERRRSACDENEGRDTTEREEKREARQW